MAEGIRLFPPGWLHTAGSEPADDLDLAVLLVNSYDQLADPVHEFVEPLGWHTDGVGGPDLVRVAALRVDSRVERMASVQPPDPGLMAIRTAAKAHARAQERGRTHLAS